MASAGSIYVDLVAKTTKYEEGTRKARNLTSSFEKEVNSAVKKASDGFNAFALTVTASVTAGAATFGLLAKNAIQSADAVAKLSDKLSLSVANVQKFQYAAKLSGVEVEKFESAVGFLNNQIAAGKLPYDDTAEALLAVADKVANAKSGIEKAGIVSEAFGAKLGRALLPMLKDGSAGLNELAAEAEALGLVMDEDLIRNAEKLSDQIDILGDVIVKNFQAEFLRGFVGESGNLRDIYSDPKFIEGVRAIGSAFGEMSRVVAESVKLFADAKALLTDLAAFGIVASGAFDKDITEQALQEAADRKNGLGSSLISAPLPKGSGVGTGSGGGGFTPGGTANKRKDEVQTIIDGLTKETVLLDVQISKYGEKEDVLNRALKAKQIEYDLYEKGIRLNETERDTLRSKLDQLQENQAKLNELKESTKGLDDIGNKLGLTFSSAFEDAIVKGEDFRDVLKGIADDLLRMLIRKQITEPVGSVISNAFKSTGGGFLSGIIGGKTQGPNPDGSAGGSTGILGALSSIFDGFIGSFDTGIDNVPKDGLAYIHKGEAVLRPGDAESWRNGGGGNIYNIDARGADAGAVRRIEMAMINLIGPGRIESRMADAQRRGAAG